jgi:hypothetical protein
VLFARKISALMVIRLVRLSSGPAAADSVHGGCCVRVSVRPTPFLPASLVWWPVYSGPQTLFRARSWSGQNNGGGVFLRISAVREDGAGVLSVAIEMGQPPCSKGGPDFCSKHIDHVGHHVI